MTLASYRAPQKTDFGPMKDTIDFDPVEHLNPGAGGPLMVVCDHATNHVPAEVGGGSLGLGEGDMGRHIAYDVGARGVSVALAEMTGAPTLMTRVSRLVIDPNRGEDDPTLVMRLYDGTIVPGNRRVAAAEVERRLAAYHRPYHAAIEAVLDRLAAAGPGPALVAVHSYTRQLRGRPVRPWHVGVLWHHDDRLARPLLARLRVEPDLCVGENQPYSGQLEGDTLSRHGTRRGLPHVLIELRNDLIASPADQRLWAARLAPMLKEAARASLMEETPHG